MKYKIVYAYPDGYYVRESRLGLIWKAALFTTTEPMKEFRFTTVDKAKESIRRLELRGKRVEG